MPVVQVRDFILTRKIGFPFSWRAGSFCKYLLSQKDEIWYDFKIIFTFLFQGSEMRSPLSFRIHFIFSFPWFCNQILPLRHFYLLPHAPSYNSNNSCFILFSLCFLILNPKINPRLTKNLLLCWMRSLAFFPLYKEAESYFFFFLTEGFSSIIPLLLILLNLDI